VDLYSLHPDYGAIALGDRITRAELVAQAIEREVGLPERRLDCRKVSTRGGTDLPGSHREPPSP
jgi:hypothetical protein